jgi:hypothetical protein
MQKRTQKIYQWLYPQLEYTNRAIAPVLTAFRYRSIKSEFVSLYKNNQSSLGKRMKPENFENLQGIVKKIKVGFR